MERCLVLQSHRSPLPAAWIGRCLASVESWAEAAGFAYRLLDDALLDRIPIDLREKTQSQVVVATDLARLMALQDALAAGFDTVVWCDADFLVFSPEDLVLPDSSYGLGREVWVQMEQNGPRARVKVHNAFVFFRDGNPFLDFYADAAERLLREHEGAFAPQFIGPKLLTAIHNIVRCPVVERAGMLSPSVMRDLLGGGGPSLDLFRAQSREPAAGVNLCASLSAKGEVSDGDLERAIDLLLHGGRV